MMHVTMNELFEYTFMPFDKKYFSKVSKHLHFKFQ